MGIIVMPFMGTSPLLYFWRLFSNDPANGPPCELLLHFHASAKPNTSDNFKNNVMLDLVWYF